MWLGFALVVWLQQGSLDFVRIRVSYRLGLGLRQIVFCVFAKDT